MELDEAIKLVKENARARFDESIELHIKLGIDPKKSEQLVRGTVVLPHGTGRSKKIAAFVTQAKSKEAKEAGAYLVGGEDLITKIKQTKKCDFDIAVAEPAMMKDLAQIARILGPKGLMPTPKNETVTTDIKKTIEQLKKGKITFKNDDTGNIHQIVGKISWSETKLKENLEKFLKVVKETKPSGVKGLFMKNIVLVSTMGKAIRVNL